MVIECTEAGVLVVKLKVTKQVVNAASPVLSMVGGLHGVE
jgi:hypothetical protein